MSFINPIALLQLTSYDLAAINDQLIATAKEELLAEIAQTGRAIYRGKAISPVACQMALVGLMDPGKLAAYHRIANNTILSEFLATGNANFFFPFKWDPMYHDEDCLHIISPHFADAYNMHLMVSYLKEDFTDVFRQLLAVPLLVIEKDKVKVYADLRRSIDETLSTLTQIRGTMNDPQYQNDIAGIRGLFKKYLPVDKINLFPPALESLRSRIEKEVHALSISTNNEQLLQVTIPFLAALKKTPPTAAEAASAANESDLSALAEYQALREELRILIARIGTNSVDLMDVIQWVEQYIHINTLNEFSPAFDLFRNQLAMDLAALTVALHSRTKNAAAAMEYIELAEQLVHLDKDTRESLANTQADLQEYINDPKKERPVINEERAHKPLSMWQIVLIVIFALRLLFFFFRLANPTNEYSNMRVTYSTPYQTTEKRQSFSPENFQSIDTHQPSTGDAPLDKCFGKGLYNGKAALTIINNRNLNVVVCLYDKKLKRTIRNVYIRQKSDYTIPQLKPGSYTVEIYMGQDWSNDAKNECGGTGAFTSSLVHKSVKEPVVVKATTGTEVPAAFEIKEPAGHI